MASTLVIRVILDVCEISYSGKRARTDSRLTGFWGILPQPAARF
jgi:hypothetical protein